MPNGWIQGLAYQSDTAGEQSDDFDPRPVDNATVRHRESDSYGLQGCLSRRALAELSRGPDSALQRFGARENCFLRLDSASPCTEHFSCRKNAVSEVVAAERIDVQHEQRSLCDGRSDQGSLIRLLTRKVPPRSGRRRSPESQRHARISRRNAKLIGC